MKERPILFSAPMVRAILDGRKTQTRRIVKPQPIEVPVTLDNHSGVTLFRPKKDNSMQGVHESWLKKGMLHQWKCRYGNVGDHLWVRETFWHNDEINGINGCCYRADGEMPRHMTESKWRPSIFMPRWASRIQLEITGVRVERLQDISKEDAIAEGITHHSMNDPRVEYQWLWESINGKGSWDTNPFVWVIEFKMAPL